LEQKKGIVSGYPVEQFILDLLVWLPGKETENELLEWLWQQKEGWGFFCHLFVFRDRSLYAAPGWPWTPDPPSSWDLQS
jgi:hypothetical protein